MGIRDRLARWLGFGEVTMNLYVPMKGPILHPRTGVELYPELPLYHYRRLLEEHLQDFIADRRDEGIEIEVVSRHVERIIEPADGQHKARMRVEFNERYPTATIGGGAHD